jgi:hypothetical protein
MGVKRCLKSAGKVPLYGASVVEWEHSTGLHWSAVRMQPLPSRFFWEVDLSEAQPGAAANAPPQSFAALRHRGFRIYFITATLAMMADSIEHVISYWIIFQKFQSPALGGFAVLSHWFTWARSACARSAA